MNEAYLCLGGNLGNCLETFAKAEQLLAHNNIIINCKSNIYVSEAWGMENAPNFHNQVLKINTPLTAVGLMTLLLSIEKQLGRERTEGERYSSRTIDIDLLLFNSEIINVPNLTVPHPRMEQRRFVLEPLSEIASSVLHPVLKKTIKQLLEACKDTCAVKKMSHAF